MFDIVKGLKILNTAVPLSYAHKGFSIEVEAEGQDIRVTVYRGATKRWGFMVEKCLINAGTDEMFFMMKIHAIADEARSNFISSDSSLRQYGWGEVKFDPRSVLKMDVGA